VADEPSDKGEPTEEVTVPSEYGEIPDPPPEGTPGSDFHEPPPPQDGTFHPMPDPATRPM
jgi:hypothetical protein